MFRWHWGSAPQEPFLAVKDLPPERIVLWYDLVSKADYWAAYKKGKQVNGGRLAHFDSIRDIHFVHTLQVVLGYGPVYLRHAEIEYYKVNLFLIGYDSDDLSTTPTVSYHFDPTDV